MLNFEGGVEVTNIDCPVLFIGNLNADYLLRSITFLIHFIMVQAKMVSLGSCYQVVPPHTKSHRRTGVAQH